jgi:hypothetical protein
MLVYYMIMFVLYFIHLFNANHHGIGYGLVHVYQTKTDRCHAYVIHSAVLLFLL